MAFRALYFPLIEGLLTHCNMVIIVLNLVGTIPETI